jgi:hypothetical protein
MSSEKASALYANGYFDFVYLDADHTYKGAAKDIELWYPKVRSGGILSGHDYKNKRIRPGIVCGVVQAVDEFVSKNKLEFTIGHGRCPSWFVLKP